MNATTSTKSVLIIGATGRSGLECLRQLAAHPAKPAVHAFCRDAKKLDDQDQALCTSIVEGNARSESDIERALRSTKADAVVVSIGNGDSVAKSDIRTASAEALVNILKKPEFKQVEAVVVSSTGAGASKIIVGGGIGKLISYCPCDEFDGQRSHGQAR